MNRLFILLIGLPLLWITLWMWSKIGLAIQ